MRSLHILLPLLAMTACGPEETDDEEGGVTGEILDGTWRMLPGSAPVDSCGQGDAALDDIEGDDEEWFLDLVMDGDTVFATPETGEEEACVFDGASYVCEGYSDAVDFSSAGYDAQLDIVGSRWLDFTSDVAGTMSYEITSTCTGADCDDPMVQTLNGGIPTTCEVLLQWPLEHVE